MLALLAKCTKLEVIDFLINWPALQWEYCRFGEDEPSPEFRLPPIAKPEEVEVDAWRCFTVPDVFFSAKLDRATAQKL